jgi:homoaconitase/3-isopropylmalate dehydratase large subunit
MAAVLARGIVDKVPKTLKIVLQGRLAEVWSAKMSCCTSSVTLLGAALYRAIEFTGPAVSAMSIDSR